MVLMCLFFGIKKNKEKQKAEETLTGFVFFGSRSESQLMGFFSGSRKF